MLNKNIVLKNIFFPLILVLLFDQISKFIALEKSMTTDFGPVVFGLYKNFGFALGTMETIPLSIRVVGSAVLGASMVMGFFVIQIFFPLASNLFRTGLSVFFAGAFSNIVDRIFRGYVVDFFMLDFLGVRTGVMNVADVLQWFGVGIIFYVLITKGNILWPAIENRRAKIVKPQFQLFVSFAFMSFSLAVFVLSFVLAVGYFRWGFTETATLASLEVNQLLRFYAYLMAGVGVFLAIGSFAIGVNFSHKIAGPIFVFEKYLDNLLLGQIGDLQLREQNNWFHFEGLARRFRDEFNVNLKMESEPIPTGTIVRGLHLITYNKSTIQLDKYRGKKVWLCFYRYATCPICITHLREVFAKYPQLKAANVEVIAIYDSRPEEFDRTDAGQTSSLLKSVPFPLISDPEKTIYNYFRVRKNIFALLHPTVIKTLFKARSMGFKQGRIDGDLDLVPAHVLIDEGGKVVHRHYGRHIADHISWNVIENFMRNETRES